MLIKLDDAIKLVEDRFAIVPELTLEAAVAVAIALPEALRALPVSDGVTDEMVERARQAWLEKASDYELLEVSIRAALEAAIGATVSDGWEDIATAPRDGTRILIFRDGEVYAARWFGTPWQTWGVNSKDQTGEWQPFSNVGQITWGDKVIFAGPTHWRPLPAPPTIEEKA